MSLSLSLSLSLCPSGSLSLPLSLSLSLSLALSLSLSQIPETQTENVQINIPSPFWLTSPLLGILIPLTFGLSVLAFNQQYKKIPRLSLFVLNKQNKKVMTTRNLYDWTKFTKKQRKTKKNNEKQKRRSSFLYATIFPLP